MLWVEGYKESTLSQRREDLIVESDSSMNQTLNYGENHFRLKIWSQISCLISPFISAMNLKNIHSEFINNLEGYSMSANHRNNLPVLYKYGAMLFCWDIRLHRVIAVWKSYSSCLQFPYLLNCIMVVQAHWKLSKKY